MQIQLISIRLERPFTDTEVERLLRLVPPERRQRLAHLKAVAGMTLGVAATLAQQYFGLIEIPAETFLTKSYPVEFRPTDLAVVAASFAAVAALLSNITVRSMIKTDRL